MRTDLIIFPTLYVFSANSAIKPSAEVRVFRSGRAPSTRCLTDAPNCAPVAPRGLLGRPQKESSDKRKCLSLLVLSLAAGARFLIYPRPPAGGRLPLSGGVLVPFTWCREGVFDVE